MTFYRVFVTNMCFIMQCLCMLVLNTYSNWSQIIIIIIIIIIVVVVVVVNPFKIKVQYHHKPDLFLNHYYFFMIINCVAYK